MSIAKTMKGIVKAPKAILTSLLRDPASARFAPSWIMSLFPGRNSLKDQIPWITYKARRWLDSYLEQGMRVFEYGSGGSTIYVPRRVRELVSVEHDKWWYDQISAVLADEKIANCQYVLCEPESIAPGDAPDFGLTSYTSVGKESEGLSFEKYVKTIQEYPDGSFDLVLIDGVARPSCAPVSIEKIRPGGYLMLDDSEMPYYGDVHSFLSKYQRTDFFGTNPYTTRLKQTSVWKIAPEN